MKKVVIMTAGTSLLLKSNFEKLKKKIQQCDLDAVTKGEFKDDEEEVLAYLKESSRKESEYSAEIASLRQMGLETANDKVILLHSDTPDGAFCARINALFIENEKLAQCDLNIDVIKIPDLNMENAENFVDSGLKNLIEIIEELVEKHKGWQPYVNFTGGYKGVIPALTDVARRKVLPLYYLFEPEEERKCPELIKILFQNGKLKYYAEPKRDFIPQPGQERINDD